ncbi:hypothetical protein AURDEDRAFT_172407 [Auricularia subglabra TFB-10046 SS5]|nr:hypothetical protein AURDEDRAFT_172407 [Auricularia subglabra TFB-10046 SS5]
MSEDMVVSQSAAPNGDALPPVTLATAMFSAECVSALQAATTAACREALASAPPSEIWDRVLSLVHPIIRAHAHQPNAALSPVDRVPDELLVEVFSYLPLWDRVCTAMVCHRWRNVSLGAVAQLWSTVDASYSPRACQALLARARNTPITFRHHYMHSSRALSEMIAKHLHRIRILDLELPRSYLDSPSRTPIDYSQDVASRLEAASRRTRGLTDALQRPAPVLESVRIVNHLGLDLIGLAILQSPVLHSIDLRDVDLSCLTQCAGSRTLRSLVIAIPERSGRSLPEHWFQFCAFPSLEKLAVKIRDHDTRRTPARPARFPTTLKHLYLSLSPETLMHIIDPTGFAQLSSWYLSFISPARQYADLLHVLPYLQSISPTSAAIQFDDCIFHLMVADAAGRRGTVQAIRFTPDWSSLLDGVTKLCIGGLSHLPACVADTSTALPALEHLTLDVTPLSGVSSSGWFQWPSLACPRLRSVHIRSAGGKPTTTLEDVLRFLRDSLGRVPGAEKLEALLIDRVHIKAAPDDDVLVLFRGLAKTVTMQDSDPARHVDARALLEGRGEGFIIFDPNALWPECQVVWNRSWDEISG